MLILLMLLQYGTSHLTSYYAATTAMSHAANQFGWDELIEFAADCREAHAAAPRHPWPVLASASAALSAWEFDKAVRILDAMTLPPRGQFAPPCPVAAARYTLRGAALEYGGHPAEALLAYREAVASDGSFRPARLRLGWAELGAGDHAAALAQFGALVERDHRDAEALAGRGAARYLRSKEYGELGGAVAAGPILTGQIRADLVAVSHASPASHPRWVSDREGARLDLGRAVALDPDCRVAYEYRAELRYHDGDFAGAEADYLAALRHGPSPCALVGLAASRLSGGDAEGAGRAAALGLVLTSDAKARGYLHMLGGEVAKLKGDDDEHLAALGRALEECPSDAELTRHCRAGLGQ